MRPGLVANYYCSLHDGCFSRGHYDFPDYVDEGLLHPLTKALHELLRPCQIPGQTRNAWRSLSRLELRESMLGFWRKSDDRLFAVPS